MCSDLVSGTRLCRVHYGKISLIPETLVLSRVKKPQHLHSLRGATALCLFLYVPMFGIEE